MIEALFIRRAGSVAHAAEKRVSFLESRKRILDQGQHRLFATDERRGENQAVVTLPLSSRSGTCDGWRRNTVVTSREKRKMMSNGERLRTEHFTANIYYISLEIGENDALSLKDVRDYGLRISRKNTADPFTWRDQPKAHY